MHFSGMSLCAACFQSNGHVGHDYTRFFSREGGACDCGNADVILPQGFCSRHGEHAQRPKPAEPLVASLVFFIFFRVFKSNKFSTLYDATLNVLAFKMSVISRKNKIFDKKYLRQFFCNIIEDIIL